MDKHYIIKKGFTIRLYRLYCLLVKKFKNIILYIFTSNEIVIYGKSV